MNDLFNCIFFSCCVLVCVTAQSIQQSLICANPMCSDPVSLAKPKIKYTSDDKNKLSFQKNDVVTIYGKIPNDVKQQTGYWYGEVNGKKGLISPHLIQDYKVIHKLSSLEHTIPFENIKQAQAVPTQPLFGVAAEVGDGGPPAPPYEVVDGTTLFLGPDGENIIQPTATVEHSLKTEENIPTEKSNQAETHESTESAENDSEEIDDYDNLSLENPESSTEIDNSAETSTPNPIDSKSDELSNISVTQSSGQLKETPADVDSAPIEPSTTSVTHGSTANIDPLSSIPLLSQPSTAANIAPNSVVETISSSVSRSIASGADAEQDAVQTDKVGTPKAAPGIETTEKMEAPKADVPSLPNHDKIEPTSDVPKISNTEEMKTNVPSIPNPEKIENSKTDVPAVPDTEKMYKPKIENPAISSTEKLEIPKVGVPAMPNTEEMDNSKAEIPAISSTEKLETPKTNVSENLSTEKLEIPKVGILTMPNTEEMDKSKTEIPAISSTEKMEAPKINVSENPSTEKIVTPKTDVSTTDRPISDSVVEDLIPAASMESMLPVAGTQQPAFPAGSVSSVPPIKQHSSWSAFKPPTLPSPSVNLPSSNPSEHTASAPLFPPTEPNPATANVFEAPSNAPEPNLIRENLPTTPSASEMNDEEVTEKISQPPDPSNLQEETFLATDALFQLQTPNNQNVQETTSPSDSISSKTVEPLEPEETTTPRPLYEDPRLQFALVDETTELPVSDSSNTPESPGFISELLSKFSSLFGEATDNLPEESTIVPVEPVLGVESVKSTNPSEQIDVVPDGHCNSGDIFGVNCGDALAPSSFLDFLEMKPAGGTNTLLYLIITAVSVLVFTLGYYFLEQMRQDGPLIAKINKLTHDLQVATSQLEAKSVQESLTLTEISNETVVALQLELEAVKKGKLELEGVLESQQQELEAATEAGLELNKMLSELLAQKGGPDNLLQSVEQLQGQLDSQQTVIDDMNKRLLQKTEENEALQTELAASQERAESLEEELNDTRENMNIHWKEKEDLLSELETKNSKLDAELALVRKAHTNEVGALSLQLSDVKERLAVRDSEYKALKEIVDELKKGGGFDKDSVFNVTQIKAELKRIELERDSLQERLNDEEGARKLLEEHMKAVDNEVASLRVTCDAAAKERTEAETRLAVLSNYFKEKETQLQKELGLQEAMMVQKQGDETTVFERITSLKDEVESYSFDSFPNSNEELSLGTCSSLVCAETRADSSSSGNNIGRSEPSSWTNSSPSKTASLRSLPSIPIPKPRSCVLTRGSSTEFEKKVMRVEQFSDVWAQPAPRHIPEDLLMLQELKTVHASPFRGSETSLSSSTSLSSVKSSPKRKNPVAKLVMNVLPTTRKQCTPAHNEELVKLTQLINKFERSLDSSWDRPFTPIASPSIDSTTSEKAVVYNLGTQENNIPTTVLFDLPPPLSLTDILPQDDLLSSDPPVTNNQETMVPCVRESHCRESDTEDIKECQLESSATVEFDIKVVANAKANVAKFKRKSPQPRKGAQNEILKKEILDQERSFKGQIATLEKKAHENWVAARHAERRLEESKQEAGQLRNMLTLMEKPAVDAEGKPVLQRLPGDLNGDDGLPPLLADGSSPLPFPPLPIDPMGAPPPMLPPGFLPPFMPPPPGGFMPPPPPPHFLPGDRRPAPLGRMSSPPLNSRFSPTISGEYEYDRMSPGPMSPPVRDYRSPRNFPGRLWDDGPPRGFRPVTNSRDSRRDYQGSSNLSSGNSSNESLDKPRHGGKV